MEDSYNTLAAPLQASAASSDHNDHENAPAVVTSCHVCNTILEMSSRTLREETDIYDRICVGKVKDVLSGTCLNHKDLTYHFVGNYIEEGRADQDIYIHKMINDTWLEVSNDSPFKKMFELVGEPRFMGDTPQPFLGSLTQAKPSSGFRRDKILDEGWIDLEVMKSWYYNCKENHGTACFEPSLHINLRGKPRYLIDVSQDCIVQADPLFEYVALSYVWGGTRSCELTTGNLDKFQRMHYLHEKTTRESIPLTIVHAMDLTRLLGLQYLWVDALCVIQDEEDDVKAHELSLMSGIYQNACLTIVAGDGSHADHGLRGLEGMSLPLRRSCNQTVLSLGDLGRAVIRIHEPAYKRRGINTSLDIYYQRAWTFQEYLFSRRRLIFEKGSVLWECHCTTWFEDIDCSDAFILPKSSFLDTGFSLLRQAEPDLYKLLEIITQFNKRQLTYEEDRLPAFSGLATAMSMSFAGRFLCGLPQLFFDIALLWKPRTEAKRRYTTSRKVQAQERASLPSWSWAGWAGQLMSLSWQSGIDFFTYGHRYWTSLETIPITTWYSKESIASNSLRKISTQWYSFKQNFRDPDRCPPEGWTKRTIRGKDWNFFPEGIQQIPEGYGSYFFTHTRYLRSVFWYPIPLCEGEMTSMSSAPFIVCDC